MPLFLIERTFADLVPTDDESMAAIKLVNDEIGVQWLFSFLSADKRKTFCLYEAVSPEAIRAAAQRVGIPVDAIIEVSEMGPDAAAIAALRAHRMAREDKVLRSLKAMSSAGLDALTPMVYDDVPADRHQWARLTLEAHLIKLARDGRVTERNGIWQPNRA